MWLHPFFSVKLFKSADCTCVRKRCFAISSRQPDQTCRLTGTAVKFNNVQQMLMNQSPAAVRRAEDWDYTVRWRDDIVQLDGFRDGNVCLPSGSDWNSSTTIRWISHEIWCRHLCSFLRWIVQVLLLFVQHPSSDQNVIFSNVSALWLHKITVFASMSAKQKTL